MKCKYRDIECGWDEEWWWYLFEDECQDHCSDYIGYVDQIGQF